MEAGDSRRPRCRPLVEEISLYFHIPFCTKKCPYCHFYVIPDRKPQRELLYQSLEIEWNQLKGQLTEKRVVSIYFGGGTPTLFGPEAIRGIIEMVKREALLAPNCEITLEANPESLTLERASSFREGGINRFSIGVQTLVDTSLISLGRTHTASKAIDAILIAKASGVENISIDLMLELPNQTLAELEQTLSLLPSLPITHLSLYNLTIEPHTSFYKRRNTLLLPSEEESLSLLEKAIEKIEESGLKRYEISAFAKPGFASKHNTGYWMGRTFYGLGPSAFSYVSGRRFRNVPNINRYASALREGKSPIDFEETLSLDHSAIELFAVRLRMLEGANLSDFSLPKETLQTLERLEGEGLVKATQGRVHLSGKGLLFYDTVASELMPDAPEKESVSC